MPPVYEAPPARHMPHDAPHAPAVPRVPQARNAMPAPHAQSAPRVVMPATQAPAAAHLAETGADPALLAITGGAAAGLVFGGGVLYRRGRALAQA
ncbi:hypothetical protein [Streptomyces sp. NPDC051993]